ncbi:zinc finger protein 516-like isoform X2 [Entelurus aequoreus]|uniref:zinc finger protein 516-like isoform X2 n=1 Tax=Entelurus aequoreus TaxID=161455 RepID=UPI002B1D235D|nr:zinc finger protein 516-like isoform X2 [Entelurus aequoreus]
METKGREEDPSKPTSKAETEEDESSGHTCGVCGRSFPLLSSLSQHMRRHTREKPYKCPYCDHRTAQKGSLKAHIRSHKLGLFSQNSGDTDTVQRGGDTVEPDTPEEVSGRGHNANGKVKKKASKKKDSAVEGEDDGGWDGAGTFICAVCSQVFPQVPLLKSHMKRHRGAQDHGCRICGRRFRQAWFLQSHMRIHRVKAQLRGGKGQEPPTTVNGVPQDPESLTNDECLYELCAACGNFFLDGKTLRIHEKLHKLNHRVPQDPEASEMGVTQNQFLEGLKLTRVGLQKEDKSEKQRIPELDPVCSYQAWQLATRGRLAEATEKCLGWEERLADAEVAYDTEKGEYVPIKHNKKRKQMDPLGPAVKKKKGDLGFNRAEKSLAQVKAAFSTSDKKMCQKDRILLNGLGHAFYQALQNRTVKEDGVFPKHTNDGKNKEPEDNKPFFCEHCDFHTPDVSLLRSHVHTQHQEVPASCGKQSLRSDNQSVSKASRYMDYLRKRSALLCQPYWNPYPGPPGAGLAELNIKTEKGNEEEIEVQGRESDGVLNLSSLDGDKGQVSCVKKEGLARHHCPYCSHATCYPEVLWIHQRVSHRVGTSSSVAPKWAPCVHSLRSPKTGISQWRRTGPPPFLEGKDCPTLPAPRSKRTQPPGGAPKSSSSKQTAAKSQSGAKSKPQSKDSRSKAPERKSGEQQRAAEGAGKAPSSQASSSTKGASGRTTVEGVFPKEGLGLMLARSHAGAPSNSSTDRLHPQRRSCDSSPAPKDADVWAAMSMWSHRAYFEPLLFAQGKRDTPAMDTPVDFDVLSLLKNYSPHELAALYQHWGFVDPRLDPQAMLRLNGTYGNEVHSSSEASKQVTSRSTSTSGSLHKGT